MVKGVKFLSRLLNASCSDVITVPLFFSLPPKPPPPPCLNLLDFLTTWLFLLSKQENWCQTNTGISIFFYLLTFAFRKQWFPFIASRKLKESEWKRMSIYLLLRSTKENAYFSSPAGSVLVAMTPDFRVWAPSWTGWHILPRSHGFSFLRPGTGFWWNIGEFVFAVGLFIVSLTDFN